MKTRVITISREFGSGGRTVGKQTAKLLGIPCYDQEVIEKVAQENGFAKEYIKERGEYTPYGGWFAQALTGRSARGTSPQDDLWVIQRKVILELAQKPCVIVGRCADYILRERKDCLHAFIHADMDFRSDRIVRMYGESENSPEKRLKDKDTKRRINYKHFTHREWGMAQNYHITLNSGVVGIERFVDILSQLYEQGGQG